MKKLLSLAISTFIGGGVITGVQVASADTARMNTLANNADKIASIELELNNIASSSTFNEEWDHALDALYGDDWDDLLDLKYGDDWKDTFESQLENKFNQQDDEDEDIAEPEDEEDIDDEEDLDDDKDEDEDNALDIKVDEEDEDNASTDIDDQGDADDQDDEVVETDKSNQGIISEETINTPIPLSNNIADEDEDNEIENDDDDMVSVNHN